MFNKVTHPLYSGFYFLTILLLAASYIPAQNKHDLDEHAGGYRGAYIKNLQIPDKALNFLVIGDWGRCGEYYQQDVANQLAAASMSGKASFIISTGDNFYPSGVASVEDPLWTQSFENIYHQYALQKPWYVVLGNHDYKINPQAEVDYSKRSARWIMPSRYYTQKVEINGDSTKKILFVFIDSNPFISKYYSAGDYKMQVKTQDTAAQIKWINTVLAEKDSTVIWKIVVGHHPLYTSGKRIKSPETLEFRKRFEPLLQKYKVNAYICGHEHQLEYLKPEGLTHHFISGAGSEAREVNGELSESKFKASDHGFMLFSVTDQSLLMQVINWQGSILFRHNIPIK